MKTKQMQKRTAPGAFAVLSAALLFAFCGSAWAEMVRSQTVTETRIMRYPAHTILVDGRIMQPLNISSPLAQRTIVERSVTVMPAEQPLLESWLFYPPDNRMEYRKLIADVQSPMMEKTIITYRNGQPVMVQKIQTMQSGQVTTTETKTEFRSQSQ